MESRIPSVNVATGERSGPPIPPESKVSREDVVAAHRISHRPEYGHRVSLGAIAGLVGVGALAIWSLASTFAVTPARPPQLDPDAIRQELDSSEVIEFEPSRSQDEDDIRGSGRKVARRYPDGRAWPPCRVQRVATGGCDVGKDSRKEEVA